MNPEQIEVKDFEEVRFDEQERSIGGNNPPPITEEPPAGIPPEDPEG